MKVKVKLLDRNLIRHFGGVVQMMEQSMAARYVKQRKAAYDDSNHVGGGKMEHGPPNHKAVFQAPEDKVMETFDNHRYPGREDKLFPQIKKR